MTNTMKWCCNSTSIKITIIVLHCLCSGGGGVTEILKCQCNRHNFDNGNSSHYFMLGAVNYCYVLSMLKDFCKLLVFLISFNFSFHVQFFHFSDGTHDELLSNHKLCLQCIFADERKEGPSI